MLRQPLIAVYVELGQDETPLEFACQSFQDRSQGATGAAPGCPEINHNRRLLGLFDDLLGKGAFIDFDDKGTVRHFKLRQPEFLNDEL